MKPALIKKFILVSYLTFNLIVVFIFDSYGQWNTDGTLAGSPLTTGGNVGIGKSDPQTKLHIYDVSQTPVLNITGSADLNQVASELRLSNYYHSLPGHRASIKAINDKAASRGFVAMQFSTSIYNGSHVEVEAMRISSNGYIGIGTSSPITKLSIFDINETPIINVTGSAGYGQVASEIRLTNHYETLPGHRASLKAINDKSASAGYVALQFNVSKYTGQHAEFEAMRISSSGNVGIGTTDPGSFKLAVNGKIWTQEVNVAMTNPGPDYVFEEDYDLLSLAKLEAYIKQNKHLPEVPSAKQMDEEGLNLKEMNLILLKKVEELTLHLIEKEKQLSAQQMLLESFDRKFDALQNEVESLKN